MNPDRDPQPSKVTDQARALLTEPPQNLHIKREQPDWQRILEKNTTLLETIDEVQNLKRDKSIHKNNWWGSVTWDFTKNV